jgi:hypothetical protein
MTNPEEKNEYKLLILDRIKDPARANEVMEIIANNKGDEALALVISEMETVDVARLFTEEFDYTRPNQAAALINPNIAADCILAILSRRSLSRLNESPSATAQDINDFMSSVVLTRPIEKQNDFKELFKDHIDLFAACIMCETGYLGDDLLNIIEAGEQGTMAEIASNFGLTNLLIRTVKGALGKDHIEHDSDLEEESFDASSEVTQSKFIRSTLTRFHRKAIKKFGAEAVSSMEEFMDM